MNPIYLSSLVLLLFFHPLAAQDPPLRQHPVSAHADTSGFSCKDTARFLFRKTPYELGIILPSWLPIAGKEYVAVLEGIVEARATDGSNGPLVSYEDLPFYHYSHDFTFNVLPDITADKRFRYLLPRPAADSDTLLRQTVHVEWECGLGSYNRVNPFAALNNKGSSSGFFSAGHRKMDIIRHWPAPGDWVHVEGHYVWDRGHPPAKAEIHPARLIVTRRKLPARKKHSIHGNVMCTRVDLFASGDGGALKNNRQMVPYADPTPMSDRDYKIRIVHPLAKARTESVLRFETEKRAVDSYAGPLWIDQLNDSTLLVRIPWKSSGQPDDAILSRTIWIYWDEPILPTSDQIQTYTIRLKELQFKHRAEVNGAAELRIFANIGSDWFFVNDWCSNKRGNILSGGLGKTHRKKWEVPITCEVSIPKNEVFRVALSGWEADGVDALTGKLVQPEARCSATVKSFFKKNIFNLYGISRGCTDDNLGEISENWSAERLDAMVNFTDQVEEGVNVDPCPYSSWPLKENWKISYTISPEK